MLPKTIILAILSLGLVVAYLTIEVDPNFVQFAMSLRFPKLAGMLIAAFCIGYASIVFQSIINNRIVTPCLLGMNSLYVVVHTAIAFFLGVSNSITSDPLVSFLIDLAIMGFVGTMIYSAIFKKTRYNILYILLVGTVLATFFTSISNTLVRTMDPNEYDTLLTELVAGFDHINTDLLIAAVVGIAIVILVFFRDFKLLNVLILGKWQATNLGVNYDKTVMRMLIATVFLIAIATALVGPISFLGLIIANLSRELFKTYKHSYLMLGSFLMGVLVLLVGQILIEHVFGFSAQISIFINLFGGGYFLYLILRNKGA